MKYLSILIMVVIMAGSCSNSTNEVESLSKSETVEHNKKKKWQDHDGCTNYPDCWSSRDCCLYGGCPNTGNSCRLLSSPVGSGMIIDLQKFADSVGSGRSSVANYFNNADYSKLFGFIDQAGFSDLKADLQDGSKTALYIQEDQYPSYADTSNYYIYIGDTSVMTISYNADGHIVDIDNYESKSVLPKK